MKKLLCALGIVTTLCAHGLIYPETMVVREVNGNQILAECANGNVFRFEDDGEDWVEGDLVGTIMFSWGTPKVYDDEIIATKYVGTADMFEGGN